MILKTKNPIKFMNDFEKGGVKSLEVIKDWVLKEMIKLTTSKVEPNSPRQMTRGGKLVAYNKMLQKLSTKIESIKKKAK